MPDEIPQDRPLEQPQDGLAQSQLERNLSSATPMRIGDAERSEAIQRIQRAMATGHLEFDEIGDRFETVYAAQNTRDLEPVITDLPHLATSVPTHPAPSLDIKLIGDTKKGALGDVGDGYTCVSVIGDTQLDLTALDFSAGDAKITVWTLIGDVKIIVPDGVRVQRGGVSVLGDDHEVLVPPVPGAPLVKVEVFQLIGDCKVYSLSLLPKGRLRKWWRSLRSGD